MLGCLPREQSSGADRGGAAPSERNGPRDSPSQAGGHGAPMKPSTVGRRSTCSVGAA